MSDGRKFRAGHGLLPWVLALAGGAVGSLVFLVVAIGPGWPVTTAVIRPAPEARMDASLTVAFFGRVGYVRTAPDSAAFAFEAAFWDWVPLLLAAGFGAGAGWLAGCRVDRRQKTPLHNPVVR